MTVSGWASIVSLARKGGEFISLIIDAFQLICLISCSSISKTSSVRPAMSFYRNYLSFLITKFRLRHLLHTLKACAYKSIGIINNSHYFIYLWSVTPSTKSLDQSELKKIWSFYYQQPKRIEKTLGSLEKRISSGELTRSRLPEYLFYGELLLIEKRYAECLSFSSRLNRFSYNDLRLNDLIARLNFLQEDDSNIDKDISYGYNPFQEMYCVDPFERLVLDSNYKITSCCAHWTNTTFGSFKDNSFDEIWYSDAARKFRTAVTSGSFEYCDKTACPKIRYRSLPKRSEMDKSYYLGHGEFHPAHISLSQDATCNLTCPSCRNGIVTSDNEVLKSVEESFFPQLLNADIKNLHIAGFGEPFASPHYRKLLSDINPKEHRIEKLHILTNGLMLNKKMWSSFEHLEDLPFLGMGVSIDSATPETYSVLRRGGKWDDLMESLEFIASLRAQSKINFLTFALVIQTENFLEIPAFIRMGDKFGADHIRLMYVHQGGELKEKLIYQNSAVHIQSHPRHSEYLEMLKDEAFKRPGIYFM